MALAGFLVPGLHDIGAGNDGRMGIIAGFRIQDRLLQQVHGEPVGRVVRVLVADVDAEAFVIDLASGRDHLDRVRNGHQQAGLEEVRQEISVQGDDQLVIVADFHTAQGEYVAFGAEVQGLAGYDLFPGGDIVVVTEQVLRAVDLAADRRIFDFGAHHQQEGEGIVPRGDLCAVRIVQVVRDEHVVGLVPDFVHRDLVFGDHAGIHHVGALVLVPVHQVVAVDQGADVDVRGIVAEQFGKEVALGDRGMADDQFLREFNIRRGFGRFRFSFSHFRFIRQGKHRRLEEQESQQQAQDFLQLVHDDQILPCISQSSRLHG